jgi:HEAT repeat protein
METSVHQPEALDHTTLVDDERKQIQEKLAQFILILIQAFLRTGYYTPDHPESKKAKAGLYEDFRALFIQKDELTFLVRDDPGGKNILIEGVLPEIQYLNRLMLRGMAEMYIPKFARFLERKDLISLTLKDEMTRAEFTHFVDVMSEPTFVDTRETRDKERFSRTLKERGIFHISYIFNEELLAAKRNIPWRAQIALSRLKKDLSIIPLYLNLDEDGLKKIRREIVQDVTRPIKNAETVFYVLINTDLAQTKELKESEIDAEVIVSLSDELLLKTAQTLLKDVHEQGETEAAERKRVGLVKRVTAVLNHRETEGREGILEVYFKRKLIPFEQLPTVTQRKIKLEHLTNKFLRYSRRFFDQFDKMQDKQRYLRLARSFTKIIPELIRRDRYEEILKIVTHIDRHFNEKKHLSIYAGQVLEEIGRGEIPQALAEKFLAEKKETRLAIAPIFLKLHVGAVPYLLSILKESDDKWVRKNACEILVEIGSPAINFILNELNKKEIGPESTIDILRVLGEIKSDEWIQPLANTLRAYLNQENPRLREEALWVYYRIKGREGEKLYFDLLSDTDLGVQKKAIQCLGRIKSPAALEKFLEMLEEFEEFPSIENDPLEARVFGVLGYYGNIELPEKGNSEDFLLDILDRRLSLGTFSFLKKKKNPLSEESVATICDTLGMIGTDKSAAILEKIAKQQDTQWPRRALEALTKIDQRKQNRGEESVDAA